MEHVSILKYKTKIYSRPHRKLLFPLKFNSIFVHAMARTDRQVKSGCIFSKILLSHAENFEVSPGETIAHVEHGWKTFLQTAFSGCFAAQKMVIRPSLHKVSTLEFMQNNFTILNRTNVIIGLCKKDFVPNSDLILF